MLEWLYIRPEILLFAVATLLYLHDLALPLFANEVVFVRSAGGPWVARTARRYPEFARRHLALVRPWRPDTIVIRSSWPQAAANDGNQAREIAERLPAIERRLRPLRYQSAALLATMFVGLPCLYGFLGPGAFLIGTATVYAQAAVMLAGVLVGREELGLSGKSLAFLALESLICIPYTVNLYRKITARVAPPDAEPLALAEALLDGQANAAFRRELVDALDVYIGLPGADESRQSRLIRYREQVLERSAA